MNIGGGVPNVATRITSDSMAPKHSLDFLQKGCGHETCKDEFDRDFSYYHEYSEYLIYSGQEIPLEDDTDLEDESEIFDPYQIHYGFREPNQDIEVRIDWSKFYQ
ncbi:hypothetical protein K7432_014934 [Basidiobolus ranarum]|uniref:Uncharacterized protein n=1 Tax=Basidiobolus ranarum TaxID=34480 RepID=A0ABR2WGW1_9FUNG